MGYWKMLFDRAVTGEPDDEEFKASEKRMLELLGLEPEEAEDGGPGSGNFGHSGRPGQIGGSGEGDGESGGSSGKSAKSAAYFSDLKGKCDSALNNPSITFAGFETMKLTGEMTMSFVNGLRELEKQGKADEARAEIKKKLDTFQAIMEINGDPTPNRETCNANDSEFEPGDTLRGQKAVDWLNKFTGTENGEKYNDALTAYTGGDMDEMSDEQKDALEDYIAHGKVHDGPVFRGLSFASENEREAFMKNLVPGAEFGMRDSGVSSWSTYQSIADEFAGDYADSHEKYGVVLKSIQNNSGVPISPVSEFPDEHEILCSKDARWTVLGVEKDERTGIMRVTCVERGVDNGKH